MAALITLLCTTISVAIILIAVFAISVISNQQRKNVAADVQTAILQHDYSESSPDMSTENVQILEGRYDDSQELDTTHPAIPESSTPTLDPDYDGNENALTPVPAVDMVIEQYEQEPENNSPDFFHEPDEDLQSVIHSTAKKYGAVGVQVAVIKNGSVAGTYEYGDATKDATPMGANTKIRIASISKVILAMAIMRLCELDRLNIDEDIGEYWGAPVRNPNHKSKPITMRQMLSHTSSIKVYDYGFAAGGELVRSRFLDGTCFGEGTPGSMNSWNYNNYAFAALGLTVEAATGETVNSLAAKHLFVPLGIDAAFGSGSIIGTDELATLYTNGGGVGRSVETQKRALGNTYAGERGEEFPGGLTISAYDLAKLIATLVNGGEYQGIRILSHDSVTTMQSSQGRTGGFDQCLPLRHRTNLYSEEELFYHTGSNYGVYSLVSYNPESGNGVVVLTTGADGKTDANGIYAICGEISEYIYRNK